MCYLASLSLEEELLLVVFMIPDIWFCSQTALRQVAPLSILRTMCTGMNHVKFNKTFGPYACCSCPCFFYPSEFLKGRMFLIGHHYSQCLAQCLIYRMDLINVVVDYNELVCNYSGKRCDLL